jgi:hypothetical protein
MGWRWNFSGEHDEPGTFVSKTYPQIIYGKKPYETYSATTDKLPAPLTAAKFSIDYEYEADATGSYNTSTDFSFVDNPAAEEKNIRAKMMIWIDANDMPFFESKEKITATIDGVNYQVMVDASHDALDGKWTAIGLLAENFPPSGTMNLNAYFDYFLANGVLKPEWYFSSIEIGSEVSSGKGEVTFKRFIVHDSTKLVTDKFSDMQQQDSAISTKSFGFDYCGKYIDEKGDTVSDGECESREVIFSFKKGRLHEIVDKTEGEEGCFHYTKKQYLFEADELTYLNVTSDCMSYWSTDGKGPHHAYSEEKYYYQSDTSFITRERSFEGYTQEYNAFIKKDEFIDGKNRMGEIHFKEGIELKSNFENNNMKVYAEVID